MPVRINKVYTRTGDQGETHLVGGKRVAKDCLRIEAYGTIDELNAALGLARALVEKEQNSEPQLAKLDQILRDLQQDLFDLGSQLATDPEGPRPAGFKLGPEQTTALEKLIDECQKELEPLNSFVLPGGGPVTAGLHVARTICRRAERLVVRLSRQEPVAKEILTYLNRLSDLLFVLARWSGKQLGEKELLWQRPLKKEPEGQG